MLKNYDEDSGRSSCSAGSLGTVPVIADINKDIEINNPTIAATEKKTSVNTREASTNTELRVRVNPRNNTGLLKSPEVNDPFPSCRVSRRPRSSVFGLFDTFRRGGLSDAHSTLDIASSTHIEHQKVPSNIATSLSNVSRSSILEEKYLPAKNPLTTFNRSKPVQRAASRLYRADTTAKGETKGCTGPEFIVRACQPNKLLDLTHSSLAERRTVVVILLNGKRIEAVCDPNIATAGQIFESIVCTERYEHNFMLGIAVLISGDFVFLPDEYKIKKVAPQGWYMNRSNSKGKVLKKHGSLDRLEEPSFVLFLRIKFFLPTNISKNIQGGEWRHRVYLQLRRSTVEGQLTFSVQNLILLAGYALHIEFGEFCYREHGSGDYFLLEHYLPEGSYASDVTDIKLRMKKAHESRRGIDKDKAITNFITLAQTFRDYGAHFYSAVWATRDGFCRDIWLSIGPRGVTLYSRNTCISALPQESYSGHVPSRIVLQNLPWHHIHTFYFNKKTLYIIPNSQSGHSKTGVKYKLKMADNKSYFTFWMASLHHRLYLKLYAKEDFVDYLSDELSCPVKSEPTARNLEPRFNTECSNYQDSYNMAVRNQPKLKRQTKKRFKVEFFQEKKIHKNKENEKPSTEMLLREILSTPESDDSVLNDTVKSVNALNYSSNEGISSSESCSLPRRQGVKMGTRVFSGTNIKSMFVEKHGKSPLPGNGELVTRSHADLTTAQSDSDDLYSVDHKMQHCNVNSMELLPQRLYNQSTGHLNISQGPTAYVIESPKVYQGAFSYDLANNESLVSSSLFEKLDSPACVQGVRTFVTALLRRDASGALGLQVAEGSDGNVYIKSIIPLGPADISKKLLPGDQIISVNGQTLLNMPYKSALAMLQSAPAKVELILLQNSLKKQATLDGVGLKVRSNSCLSVSNVNKFTKNVSDSVGSGMEDIELADDEIINEEALKTIHALIRLTKQNVIMRMKEKSNLSTPNKVMLQKCLSDNKVYDESDVGNSTSQESTPQKKGQQHFGTWRGRVINRPKRRPLSLYVPEDVELSEKHVLHSRTSLDDISVLEKSIFNLERSPLKDLDDHSMEDESKGDRNVALPRNFGLSRRWLGPVRYPVTPCKNGQIVRKEDAKSTGDIVRRHFVYGAGDSDEDQIFL